MAKDVGPDQLLVKYGLAAYKKHRIVAYSAYIFKALGVQFQSPRHNSGALSMQNAPWQLICACQPRTIRENIWMYHCRCVDSITDKADILFRVTTFNC